MIWIILSLVVIGLIVGLVIWMRIWVQSTESRLTNTFKSLSFDIIQKNNQSFLDLAKTSLEKYQDGAKTDLEQRQQSIEKLIHPIKESMTKLDQQHRELEKTREGAYASLQKQIEMLIDSERHLRTEAMNLSRALKSPNVRGSWGQIHLRRVVELAGMLNRCDFEEQSSQTANGRTLRPDLIIRLPGDRLIIVDAKTPLEAYLESSETVDENLQQEKLQEHAKQLQKHMKDLSSKEYWSQFQPNPEYVILFLPAESFFSAALRADPSIIEKGIHQNVVVATPTTLIAILRAIAINWNQENISKNAQQISQLGKELHERIFTLCEHWNKVGKSLNQSVDAYNQSVASLERRVLVSARKLRESGVGGVNRELKELPQIEQSTRELYIESADS